jgi:competence protein ComGF
MGLSMSIFLLINYEIVQFCKSFNNTLLQTSQHFYINEVFRFIDVELKENVKEVAVSENLLSLIKYNKRPKGNQSLVYSDIDFESTILNSISLRGEELKINYSTSATPVTLLKDVEDFHLEKYKNKLYITIKLKKGTEVKKCFDLGIIEN